MSEFNSYFKTVTYLESLARPFGGISNPEIYLQRMQYFLDLIGNPEKDLKIVHITGTAGKGSVSRLVQSMLVKDGRKTGLFTSPFVTTTIEKIQVDDLYIDPKDFVGIVNFLRPFILQSETGPYGAPTYFEIIFAIALEYFKRERCEWAVLEVGLGGRYDATNIVKVPVVTAITNIDFDHTNILGKTLDKIAYEKAGIIKKGSAFFTTEERADLNDFFKKVCGEVGATYHSVNVGGKEAFEKNEILASEIARFLKVKEQAIEAGALDFKMPARFEVVSEKPLIIIDGAHNRIKMQSTIAKLPAETKALTVIAFSEDKDIKEMLEQLVSVTQKFFITQYDTSLRNAAPAQKIADILKKIDSTIAAEVYIDPLVAFEKAKVETGERGSVLVTGSFYLAGTLRKLFYPEEFLLKNRRSF